VYRQVVRRALFRLGGGDPEVAHERVTGALRRVTAVAPARAALRRWYGVDVPRTVFGIEFPNPVGLAAGMDKNGTALAAWPALGFGFAEIGTVTWHPQPGNPRPRLFRLPDSQAVINRMGFNNAGAAALADRLAAYGPVGIPLGISIGKSKITPVEDAVADYRNSLRVLYPYGDYFAVNVSSPNTPGLRGLQDRVALYELLGALTAETVALAGQATPKPLLVKIAPDLADTAIAEVLEVCAAHRIAGLIATNTTISRDGLTGEDQRISETGGLSGRPLAERALEVVSFVHKETSGKLPVIGVGGIDSPEGALRILDAGASLLQVYTGFVYQGPGLVRRINRALAAP
jgi:dihydroorotate dehydrogenase